MIICGILHPSPKDEPIDLVYEHGVDIKKHVDRFIGKPITRRFDKEDKIGTIDNAWIEDEKMYIEGKLDQIIPDELDTLCINYKIDFPDMTVTAEGCGIFEHGAGLYKSTLIKERRLIV